MSDEFFTKLSTLFTDPTLTASARADLRVRVLADHFVTSADVSASDQAQVEAALSDALDRASAQACAQVAERIATHPRVTPALLRCLLKRGEASAAIALRHARLLDAGAALDIAERGTASSAVALAGRYDLPPALATVLFRRPEREVLIALLENPRCPLDRATAGWLVTRARRDNAIARALLHRGRLACDLTPLFLAANATMRHAMIADWRRRDLGAVPERRHIAAPELLAALASAVAREDWSSVAEQLARRLGIGRGDAVRMVTDAGGEPLALLFNAAGLPRDLFVAAASRLLRVPNDDAAIASLETMASDLPIGTARRILASIVGRPLVAPAPADRRRTEHESAAVVPRQRLALGQSLKRR